MVVMPSGLAHSPSLHSHGSDNNALVPDSLSKHPPLTAKPPSGSCASGRLTMQHLPALLVGWYGARDFHEISGKQTPKNLLEVRERRVLAQGVVELGSWTGMPTDPARLSRLTGSQLGDS